MKASELRQKNIEELNAILADKAKEQFNLRMQQGGGQLSQPDQVKKVRREIARIKTVLHEITRSQA